MHDLRGHATPSSTLAVWAVGFGGLILVTAVTYPVGVLPQIAADLDTSAGSAGLMLTVSGLTLAVVAWVTGVYARNADRRLLLVVAMAGAGAGNLLSAAAPSYLVLLLGRFAVGAGAGVFWGMVPLLLSAFGFAGIAGTMLAGRLAPASPRRAAQLIAGSMAAAVVALAAIQGRPVIAVIAFCLWGAGYGAFGVTLPLWVHARATSDHGRAAAVYIAVFNAAIAAGAALGGVAVDLTGSPPSMTAPLILSCGLLGSAVVAAQAATRRRRPIADGGASSPVEATKIG